MAIDRRLARRTDRIVVNSSGVREFYLEHGLPAEKFVVIPNAIQPSPAPGVSRDQLLAELRLPPDARLIGAVGRLWPQKRVKDLIWAADLLKVVRDDVTFANLIANHEVAGGKTRAVCQAIAAEGSSLAASSNARIASS